MSVWRRKKILDLLFCRKGAMITEDTKYFPWLIIVKTVCMLKFVSSVKTLILMHLIIIF